MRGLDARQEKTKWNCLRDFKCKQFNR